MFVFALLLAPSRHAFHTAGAREECPKLVITCPKEVPEFGKTYVVQVRVDGADSTKKLSYKWSVSSGKIVDGQGTPTLKVRFSDAGESLTATVDVGGLPDGCETSASCSFVVS
jgi:hypothetical protein